MIMKMTKSFNPTPQNTWLIIMGTIAVIVIIFGQFYIQHHVRSRVEQDVAQLKEQIAQLKNLIRDTSAVFSKATDAASLNNKIVALENKVQQNDLKLRDDFNVLVRLGIPATSIALLLLVAGLYNAVYGFARKRAEEQLKRQFLSEEEQIKKEDKIVVISPTGPTEEVSKLMRLSGFINIEQVRVDLSKASTSVDYSEIESPDLIIIDLSHDKYHSDAQIKALTEKFPKSMFLVFGRNIDRQLMGSPRLSSATFKSQIYANAMNAMKFKRNYYPIN